MSRDNIANRIFIGYPWKPYKAYWERILADFHKKFPLHFLAIGREPGQPAEQLLIKILEALDTSTYAIFDASSGNPNVSLEYGYARAIKGKGDVFLFLDEDSTIPTGPGSPIIADLAGSIANKYRLTDERLKSTLESIFNRHPYVKRFNGFCRKRGYRGGTRRFLIRIIRQFDGKDTVLRRELIDDLTHESRKPERYVENWLDELHKGGLLTVTRGNKYSSRVYISA